MQARSKYMAGYFWRLMFVWTGAIVVLFLSDCWHLGRTIEEIAIVEARAYLNKDQAFRRWAASHGGVYVPVSAKTPPNPFLRHVPERDIQSPGGQRLTLMNPAYMMRQFMTDYDRQYHVRGHITSLKYFREETAPDAWERTALAAFEKGSREVREFTETRGESHLRIMKPLIAESRCLKCHATQGYKVGDIRGGISLDLPMRPYSDYRRSEIVAHILSFGALWLIGSAGIWLAGSKLSRYMVQRDEAEDLLQIAQKNNQTLIDNALTGIYIDQDGVIKFSNAKFAEIHGYRPPELEGKPSDSLIHPLDRKYAAALYRERLQGQKAAEEYEIRCVTSDGTTIWVQRRNAMITHNGKPAVLGNEIDITRKKQAEDELKASEGQLKRVVARLIQHQEVERKSVALQIHENIAQSLSAVKLNLEASVDREAESPSHDPEFVRPIIERIKETINLIRRLTKRLSPIMLDDLGIKTAISAMCRDVMETSQGSEIITCIDIDERLIPGELKIVIYRVLEELLTLSSGHCRKDRWTVSLETYEGHISLAVREMEPPVRQLTEKPGWDMGLAVIKNRVESSAGSLMIESAEENKTTITVQWPLTAASSQL